MPVEAARLVAELAGDRDLPVHDKVFQLVVAQRPQHSLDLAIGVPSSTLLVSESGINTRADLEKLSEAGINCFLVGESLMRQPDVTAATVKLLKGADVVVSG